MKRMAVPNEFLLGRTLAHNVVNKETGEILANANEEITDDAAAKLAEAGVDSIKTIYTNDLDQGAYISQTLAIDETADQMAARVAIYRMMRPGEPPTEDAVETLFNGLFYLGRPLRPFGGRPHEVQPPGLSGEDRGQGAGLAAPLLRPHGREGRSARARFERRHPRW